uniref:Uncharacterized protein n=1 Tax=Schistosoma curassoni TaxID=6186 RepID=A0A183KPW7_9TREM
MYMEDKHTGCLASISKAFSRGKSGRYQGACDNSLISSGTFCVGTFGVEHGDVGGTGRCCSVGFSNFESPGCGLLPNIEHVCSPLVQPGVHVQRLLIGKLLSELESG